MSKAAIKATYIELLKETYPGIYIAGSRPLALANEAADTALAGRIKLAGDCWFAALKAHNIQKTATMKILAALPD